jgi:predicted cupin superfamily sugar epimerase
MSHVDEVIERLSLRPHPEGGAYVETWRADAEPGERASGSAIYYLLRAGERSHWHRVDAAEVWHYYAGDPLELAVAPASGEEPAQRFVLGPEVTEGHHPQVVVPAGDWQSALTRGEWTLVGCTVSPAFSFDGWELAEPDWEPGHR